MLVIKERSEKMVYPDNSVCGTCSKPMNGHVPTEACIEEAREYEEAADWKQQQEEEAREERVALRQEEHDAWREDRYYARLAEQQEQEERARAWRLENAPPDRKWLEWMDTLAQLQEITSANYAAHGIYIQEEVK
jgi:L-lactate utilization protein LutB